MDAFEKFLRLVDFSEDELPVQLPLWKRACKMLGLTKEDVRHAAEEWIPTYWDMSLHGVRKCIGAYIRELIEMTRLKEYKEQGHKILYSTNPAPPICVYANKLAGDNALHISQPDYLMSTVLGTFFHKNSQGSGNDSSCPPLLCCHCGKNRARIDALKNGIIASADVMWNWGLLCDESPKTGEILGELEKRTQNCVFTTVSKDVPLGVHEADDEARVDYFASQLRVSQQQISEFTGIEVKHEHLRRAAEEYSDYLGKLDELERLVLYSDPQPVSANDFYIFGAAARSSFDTGYFWFSEAIDAMLEEVRALVNEGKGPLPKGAPRLACSYVPYTLPWVAREFLNNGINLTTSIQFAYAGMLRKYSDFSDVYRLVVQQWLSNPYAVNMMDEANIVSEMLTSCPADGVMYGFLSFDCWLGALHKLTVRIVEERTGIPHYYLEGNFWNDAKIPQKDRLARIEAIAYKVKINRMVSGWNNG